MIQSTVKNAQQLIQPWTHWFLYGDSGSGKTLAASTFPRPVFLVPQNEGSITSLRGRDVPYYEIVDMGSALVSGRGGMLRVLDELEAMYAEDPNTFPYDTVVVESLSHYCDLVTEELTGGGIRPMDQFRWGQLSSHLRTIQVRLRRLDVHAVFTSLARTTTADDGTVIGDAMIPGQSSIKLPAACDVIGYCEVTTSKNNPVHRIHFRRHKHFIARSRFDGLPATIDNFSFQQVETLLQVAPSV
jgi:hypothetical protein